MGRLLHKNTTRITLSALLLCLAFFPGLVYGGVFDMGQAMPFDPDAVEGRGIALFVYRFVLTFLGFITLMMGRVMDGVLQNFVFGYGDLYLSTFGDAVEITWVTIRDLMNVAFIFGLVYIGFRFILFADDGAAKRNLALLIIAALLVNFSLFFAKAIVDVSHGILYEFNSMVEFVDLEEGEEGEEARFDSLSGAIMYTYAITSVLGGDGSSSITNVEGRSGWIMVALITVTFLLLSFVFIAVAVILVIRTTIITFLLIFSPIMFIGWVFPALANLSRTWLRTFISQSFLAPLIFLFLYISLIITDAIFRAPTDGERGSLVDLDFQVYAGFVLGITFLIISLIAAQKLGSSAAGASVQMLDNGRRRLQRGSVNMAKGTYRTGGRALAAGTGAFMRNTRGLSAQKKLDDFKAGKIHLNQKEFEKYQRRAQASYDPRMMGTWMKKGTALGVKTGGVQKQIKDEQKRREKYDDGKGELDINKYAEMSYPELKTQADEFYKNNTAEKEAFLKRIQDYQKTDAEIAEKEKKIEQSQGSDVAKYAKMTPEALQNHANQLYKGKENAGEKEAFLKRIEDYQKTDTEIAEKEKKIEQSQGSVDFPGKLSEEQLKEEKRNLELLKQERDAIGKLSEEQLKEEKRNLELLKQERDAKESQVRYARQLAQIDAEMAEQARNQTSGNVGVGSTSAGAVTGGTAAALGTAGAGAALIALPAVAAGAVTGGAVITARQARQHRDQAVTQSALRRIGSDGRKFDTNKRRKERLEELTKTMQEEGVASNIESDKDDKQ